MYQNDEYQHLLNNFGAEAFRLETLREYMFGMDEEYFNKYAGGDFLPDKAWTERPWLEKITAASRQDRHYRLVRLLPQVLTPYLRFEVDWAYQWSAAAGMEIYILQEPDPFYAEALSAGDFWLFDRSRAARLHYADRGAFQGATLVGPDELERLITVRDTALNNAVPFRDYLCSWRARA